MPSENTRPEKRKISAHKRKDKIIAESVAVRHVNREDQDIQSASHLRGGLGLTQDLGVSNVEIKECDRIIDLGLNGTFRKKIKGPGANYEGAQIMVRLPDGQLKGFLFSTDQPVGKENAIELLHLRAKETYPDGVEEIASRQYRHYQWSKEQQSMVSPSIPEWLKNNEKVPSEEMRSAVDYFIAQSNDGATRFYDSNLVFAGRIAEEKIGWPRQDPITNEEASAYAETLGANTATFVSDSTDFLIVPDDFDPDSDPSEQSSEIYKAIEMDIPIIKFGDMAEEVADNTAAWQAEEYRSNRRGNRFAAMKNYLPGIIKDRYNQNDPDRTVDHDVAIAKTMRDIQCAHRWGPKVRVDTRKSNPIHSTGEVYNNRTCQKCNSTEIFGNISYYRWAGD